MSCLSLHSFIYSQYISIKESSNVSSRYLRICFLPNDSSKKLGPFTLFDGNFPLLLLSSALTAAIVPCTALSICIGLISPS